MCRVKFAMESGITGRHLEVKYKGKSIYRRAEYDGGRGADLF